MTAEMIEWTLLLLEWLKERVLEDWPETRLRGSAPELDPDGYTIRFRENGDEYWMVILPEVIQRVPVDRVEDLLFSERWVDRMKATGCLHIGLREEEGSHPQLHPCPYTAGSPRPSNRPDFQFTELHPDLIL